MRRLVLALLLVACGSPDEPGCDVADMSPTSIPPTYAVVSSDYTSTAIGLLDVGGALLTAAWVDSGTVEPGIVAALSGDVSLPTAPFGPCTVVLLDRYGTDVVSWLDACGGAPRARQLDVGSAFAANPHDLLQVAGAAWVTRYGVNPAAAPDALDRGNDVVLLRDGVIAGRIDLGADDGDALARPGRLARVQSIAGERIVVGLARLSADFATTAPGAFALVRPDSPPEVRVVPLEGLSNCAEVDAVDGVAVITCQGESFADEAGRRAGAGLAVVTLGSLESVRIVYWRASEHPDVPVPTGPTIPISAWEWVTVAWGDLAEGTPDRVLRLADDAAELLFEAEAFTVGDGVYDADADLLLLPDAEAGVVRRLRADGTALAPVATTGCHGLPPREVRRVPFP